MDVRFVASAPAPVEKGKRRSKWGSPEARRRFVDGLAEQLQVKRPEDWRVLSAQEVVRRGGGGLLKRFSGSVLAMLQDAYPDQGLTELACRRNKGRGYWDDEEHQTAFLMHLQHQLDIASPQQWLRVRKEDVLQHGGAGLLSRYATLEEMLQRLLPRTGVRVDWAERGGGGGGRVPRAARPRNHWAAHENRRAFLEAFADERGIRSAAEWREVSTADVVAAGGSRMLLWYGGSLLAALRDLYPGEEWEESACRPVLRRGYWADERQVLAFVKRAEEQLELHAPADWYRVSYAQLKSVAAGDGFLRQVGLATGLALAYPEEKWDPDLLSMAGKKATQRVLRLNVSKLFPKDEILEDHKHSHLASAGSGHLLELDIYLPGRQLAFEYNGFQHYHELGFFGPLELVQARDAQKVALCEDLGIKLVTVPYWWSNDLESLAATLHSRYPALLRSAASDYDL